jgi:hypothetical protein
MQKSIPELVNGPNVAATKVEPSLKPAEPEVIVISSDDESEVKEKQADKGRKIRERSTKKNAKAFSSVLSARSKVIILLNLFCNSYMKYGLGFRVLFFNVD